MIILLINTIKIIEKEIGGLPNCLYYLIGYSDTSNSRNFGIAKTKGIYIMFVDGDD